MNRPALNGRSSHRRRRYTSLALRFLGPLIAIVIYWKIDIPDLWGNVRTAVPSLIVVSVMLSLAAIAVRGIRWYFLLKHFGYTGSLLKVIHVQFIGVSVGAITPGKVGEFVKFAYLCVDDQTRRGRFFLSTLVERTFDVGSLLFGGIIAISIVLSDQLSVGGGVTELLALSMPLLILWFVGWHWRKAIIDFIVRRVAFIAPEKFAHKLLSVGDYLVSIRYREMAIFFAISLFVWGIYFAIYIVVAHSLSISVSLGALLCSATLAALVVPIPVSISGIGTREAALIYGFALFGAPAFEAVAIAFVILILNVIMALFGSLLSLFITSKEVA